MPSRCGTEGEHSRHFRNWKPMLTARTFQPCPFCLEDVFTQLRKFAGLSNEPTWNLPCSEVNARVLSCAWPVDLPSRTSRGMSARVCVQDMSSLTYTGAGTGSRAGSCGTGIKGPGLEPDPFWHPDAEVRRSQVQGPAGTSGAGVRTRMIAGVVQVTVPGIRCVSRTLAGHQAERRTVGASHLLGPVARGFPPRGSRARRTGVSCLQVSSAPARRPVAVSLVRLSSKRLDQAMVRGPSFSSGTATSGTTHRQSCRVCGVETQTTTTKVAGRRYGA